MITFIQHFFSFLLGKELSSTWTFLCQSNPLKCDQVLQSRNQVFQAGSISLNKRKEGPSPLSFYGR